MKGRLKRLNERKTALLKAMRGVLEKAETEGRDPTADERKAYDAHKAELGVPATGDKAATGIFADIEREEELAQFERHDTTGRSVDDGADLGGAPNVKKIRIEGLTRRTKYFKTPEEAYLAGRFYRAVLLKNEGDAAWLKEQGIEMLAASPAASSGSNSIGGILLPDVISNRIIDLRESYGLFRQSAEVAPMTSDTLVYPRRLSGVTVTFPSQNDDVTPSTTPKFDGVSLTAREAVALMAYPRALAEGAVISFADYCTREIAYAFAKKEDECGFIGDGTSTYGRMVGVATKINDGNHAGSIVTAAAGNTGFETLDLVDFTACVGKLPQYAHAGAAWYISSPGYAASMLALMLGATGNSVADLQGKVTPMFLGFPVRITPCLNATLGADASKIKCLLGDLSLAATLGDRGQLAITSDASVYFTARQIAVMGVAQFDINAHDLGDATNAGPIVALKTPGA